MIELTSALLRSLTGAETNSIVTISASSKFVNTVTDNDVEYCGFHVPERLFQWIKSSVKTEGVRMLVKERQEAQLFITHNKAENGYSFGIKRDDKKAGYWSGLYATLDEAVADVDTLIAMITAADYVTRSRIVRAALADSNLSAQN